ncbi:MAG: chromosomal replication initiator protein DnaA [Kiritimatiellae bacterium]|nr:chromosomal replication initiator protein DnaA [Kiritimatiellia bacterium]
METNSKNSALWTAIVRQVKNLLPTEMERSRMDRYFPLMHSPRLEGNAYLIEVDEQIQIEMFNELYEQLINEALQMNQLEGVKVKFIINAAKQSGEPTPLPPQIYHPVQTVQQTQAIVHGMPNATPLHENYTFNNFVQGPSNSFAYAAAKAVAKGPGRTSYNPLFIYGGTGLGKTHLMEAIGHYVLQHSPGLSVCCLTSENFLNEYVNAVANDAMPAFRERYRKVDLILLDDVQFMAEKKQFQEEFFNTFNSLMLKQKQVVMTSDVAPKDLKGCEERLTGRFQQGMVVEIESPSYETRLAILKSKAVNQRHLVPEEILKFIAENIRSHVRAIEGALNRIITFMDLNVDLPLTIEIAQHLLKDSIEEEKVIKDLTVDEIMRTVAFSYNVKIDEILSKERTQTLVTPRQVAMFLSCKLTTKSLPEIGASFNKTHATVYHGAQTIQKRLDVEVELKKKVEEITAKLGRKLSDIMN